jgi:hypothetical protein
MCCCHQNNLCVYLLFYSEPVPDRGFYTPQRVNDGFIGLSSTEQAEDIMFICDRKTEILGLLIQHVKLVRNGTALNVTYSNNIRLRGGPDPGLVRIPAVEVAFVQGPSTPRQINRTNNGKSAGGRPGQGSRGGASTSGAQPVPADLPVALTNTEFRASYTNSNNTLTVSAEPGLAQDVVEERRKRQVQRQKRAEQRRKQAEAERKERNAAREKERERDRLVRLQEKKARKKAEKEAKRRAREVANGVNVDSAVPGKRANGTKAGGMVKPAPAVDDNSLAADNGRSRNVNVAGKSQSFSEAPVVPAGPKGSALRQGSPRGGVPAVGGGANNELAAAMARRRAANNES